MASRGLAEAHRVAVIGGGISGLAAAWYLQQAGSGGRITLLEASSRLGGALQTERRGGYLLELGADMFTTQEPWAWQLCRDIGFADQLQGTNSEHRQAFVVRRGRLHPVPAGFSLLKATRLRPFLRSQLLSTWGKLRYLAEYALPPRPPSHDESLSSFARRRFGREAFDHLIQPLVSGIYTADPEKLSMAATLPAYLAMEREQGSVLRAVRKDRTAQVEREAAGVRYGAFMAPRSGMQSLIEHLATKLSDVEIRRRAPVTRIQKVEQGWRLELEPGVSEVYSALILAVPAPVASRLLQDIDPLLSQELAAFEFASSAVVACGYPLARLQHPLNGFGFVVPACEGRQILAGSFSHVKFAGRAPAQHALIRVFIGGALQPELLERSDEELVTLAQRELGDLLGARGTPDLVQVIRWPQAMPQYHIAHLDRVTRVEQRLANWPQLALAGNAYRGVGVPFCVRSGELAARKILAAFPHQPSPAADFPAPLRP